MLEDYEALDFLFTIYNFVQMTVHLMNFGAWIKVAYLAKRNVMEYPTVQIKAMKCNVVRDDVW